MDQNRSKLIDSFIGNISNAILHKILENAIDDKDIANKYLKESKNSWDIAKKYREKINPVNTYLPDKDINYIKQKITNKVRAELLIRISKGYENINLKIVEKFVDKTLQEMNVI